MKRAHRTLASCAPFAVLLVAACRPASAQHAARDAGQLDARPPPPPARVVVPRGFRALGAPGAGTYSARVERDESGYPTMELHQSHRSVVEITLTLGADGAVTLDASGTVWRSSSRSHFAGGRLPDGAPGDESHASSQALRASLVGCWRVDRGEVALRLGPAPAFRCTGDAGAPGLSWRCASVDGAPVGLAHAPVLVCQPSNAAAEIELLDESGVSLDQPLAPPPFGVWSFRWDNQWLVLGADRGLGVQFTVRNWSVHDVPRLVVAPR